LARPSYIDLFTGKDLGESKVCQHDVAGRIYEHVARLEVAMDDAFVVGVLHRLGDCSDKLRGILEGKVLGVDPLLQARAFDKVHHNEIASFWRPPDAVDIDDVPMPQLRDSLRFAHEAPDPFGVSWAGVFEHLDGDALVQALLNRFPHLAHPTTAKEAFEPKIAKRERRGGIEDGIRERILLIALPGACSRRLPLSIWRPGDCHGAYRQFRRFAIEELDGRRTVMLSKLSRPRLVRRTRRSLGIRCNRFRYTIKGLKLVFLVSHFSHLMGKSRE